MADDPNDDIELMIQDDEDKEELEGNIEERERESITEENHGQILMEDHQDETEPILVPEVFKERMAEEVPEQAIDDKANERVEEEDDVNIYMSK
jgi:hypothetical protein